MKNNICLLWLGGYIEGGYIEHSICFTDVIVWYIVGGVYMINKQQMASVFGLGFTLLFNVAPLFQWCIIIKNKSSYNNSYGLWLCGVFGQMCVLSYYYCLNVHGVFNYVNSIIGLVLNLCMVISIYAYRDKR